MSSILVFGASGAVGRFLLPRLAPFYHVLPVSRRPAAVDWIAGDLNSSDFAWPAADIVFSLGPLDAFAGAFQRLRPAGVVRIVALSSMSAESKVDSSDPAERELAARLADAERRLAATAAACGAALTLFRPTLIYGAGTDASLTPLARFAARWRVLPVPTGATGLRQPVHADDLAAACAAVLDRPATFGRTYQLGGAERITAATMLRRVAAAESAIAVPVPVPLAWLAALAGRARRAAVMRLAQGLIADNEPAAADFGYAPRAFDAAALRPRRT